MTRKNLLPSKGDETRALILDVAVQHAAVAGFDALTIGTLAAQTSLSKSGLFAHFGSKEELQIATLDEAVRRFTEAAVLPSLKVPRGEKRITVLFENWLKWTENCGLKACPMMSASNEFDDKPGTMRDAIAHQMQRLDAEIIGNIKSAIEAGDFAADTDPEQFTFDIFGIIASYYRSRNLFHDKRANQRALQAYGRLLANVRPEKPQQALT